MRRGFVLAALIARAPLARADDAVAATEHRQPEPESLPAPQPAPAPAPPDHTAGEVDGAPVPGAESGRTDRIDPGDSAFRIAARAVLFVPKLAVEAALTPMRGTIWANDRYDLVDRYYDLLYNRDRTIGFDPVLSYQTGFGGVAGARFVDLDLAGDKEQLTLQAAAGYDGQQSHALALRSGQRLGRDVRLSFDGNFERRPRDAFYGLGNAALGIASYHHYGEERVATTAEVRVASDLWTVGHAALADVAVDSSAAPHAYGELEVRWDSRRRATPWEPRDVHGTGSLASVFVGRVARLDGAPDFWRYGGELQHFFRIASGPRVLALRAHAEAITGPTADLPFEELPQLGGDTFLRGYPFGRFRDRVAAFGSAQYQWDLSRYFDAYLFSDVGRVYSAVDQLGFDHLRVGYGVGLEAHDVGGHFLVETAIASSLDGDFILTLSLNPVLDARPRWR